MEKYGGKLFLTLFAFESTDVHRSCTFYGTDCALRLQIAASPHCTDKDAKVD